MENVKGGRRDDNKQEELTLLQYLKSKSEDVFLENIPVDAIRDLHDKRWRNALGFFSCSVMLAVFIYFVVSTYQSTMNSPFISVDMGAGTCSYVSKDITGDYLLSLDGYWEGQPNFVYSRSLLRLKFNNLVATNETFATLIQNISVLFSPGFSVYEDFKTRPLAQNLIYMQAIQLSDVVSGNEQIIEFVTEPDVVYSGYNSYIATADSTTSNCFYPRLITTAATTGIMSTTVDVSTMQNMCPSGMDLLNALLYNQYLHGNQFTISFDMRSVVVAIALNYGMLHASDVELVVFPDYVDVVQKIDYNGTAFTVSQYFSKRYAGMSPVICVAYTDSGEIVICLIIIGNKMLLPVVNSFGGANASLGLFDYCDCSLDVGTSSACNKLNTMVSFITSRASFTSTYDEISFFLDIVFALTNYDTVAYYSYFASLANVEFTGAASIYLSEICVGDCFMVSVMISQLISQSVSPYEFQLGDGSCSSSMFDDIPWDQLADNPPLNLNEGYYTCVSTSGDALFNAFGVSNGNAALAMQIFALLLLPIIFYISQAVGVQPRKAEYEKEEVQQILNDIAVQVLRVRDGKTRGIAKKSFLRVLESDLSSAQKEVAGYADSDDEDEERPMQELKFIDAADRNDD